MHFQNQRIRQHLHAGLIKGLLDVLGSRIQRSAIQKLFPGQLLIIAVPEGHPEEHQQRVHELLFVGQAVAHQLVIGVDQTDDLLKIPLPLPVVGVCDQRDSAEIVLPPVCHWGKCRRGQIIAAQLLHAGVRIDGHRVIRLTGHGPPLVPDHAEELFVLYAGVADQYAVARVNVRRPGHGHLIVRRIAQLHAVAHDAHVLANVGVNGRDLLGVVGVLQCRNIHRLIVRGQHTRCLIRSGCRYTLVLFGIGVVLDRLAQVVAQDDVSDVLGVVDGHNTFALLRWLLGVVMSPQVIPMEFVIAPVCLFGRRNQVLEYLPLDVLQVWHLRPV